MANDAVTTIETTAFGLRGPFTVDVLEAVRTAEGWRETGVLLGRVRVLQCWGPMHVSTAAREAAQKAFGGRGEGRTYYFGNVTEEA